MIPSLRKKFNKEFTKEKYEKFLQDLNSKHPGAIEFRVAETPVFVPKDFTEKLVGACESIVDVIIHANFKELTSRAVPQSDYIPNEDDRAHMIAFDFGVCENSEGALEPQLIEMQGFPTLFAFQVYYPSVIKNHFDIPSNFSQYLDHYEEASYLKDLREVILSDTPVENTILLEIKPHEQKTRIDF